MSSLDVLSRRNFVALTAAAPLALTAAAHRKIPVGLELYSVRGDLKKDPENTLKEVAKLGYQGVEFFSPYFDWKPEHAKEVKKQLDDLNIKCFSTHNGLKSFEGDGLSHAIELNTILGSKLVVLASAGKIADLDGWKTLADKVTAATDKLSAAKLRGGYHNHQLEFTPISGKRPMEVLAKNTPKKFVLQLDVGTCIEAGSDPVAWIKQNPGRIVSMHCKEWSKDKGYHVLFNEGGVPWEKIFQAAESAGGVEYYLIEQEGSDYSEMETAKRCLDSFRKLRSA